DPPFSPRNFYVLKQTGFLPPFLTFYYLGSLSAGYFTGYFLLLFGKYGRDRERSRAGRQAAAPAQPLNGLVFAGVWLFAAFAVTGLVYKNGPQIRSANDETFKTFGSLTVENLPAVGGICLSD